MFRNVTPVKAISFTHLCVTMSYCWPPPLDATRTQMIVYKFFRILSIINGILLFLPLLYALHVYRNDLENLPKAAVLVIAVSQVIIQTSLCTTQYDRYQLLIDEMKVCCDNANSFEKEVFQRYVDKYSTFYGISATWFYLTPTIFLVGILFISDPFPTKAEYPFPVNFEPVRSIIFVQQWIVSMQCAAHVSMNIFCALMLLFAAARFEILRADVRGITDNESLVKCVKKYMAVKRYATEASKGMRIIALLTIVFSFVACAFSAISIISRTSFTVKVQSVFLLGTGLLEAFMCALPADHLMEMSETVMTAAYESEWYKEPVSLQRAILLMLIPQRPITLSVDCIMPALSLNYFCSFMSSVFSLYTALRLVLANDDDD